MIQRATVLVLAGVLLAGCRDDSVPNGVWGGDHAVLTVTDNGGRVEFDCAHGTLDYPLQVDEGGRFSVAGTFVPEHGGPVRPGEVPESRPARYQGRLDRQKLEFTVTTEGQTGSEPFTVTLGKGPKLTKCL
jgi:hypothetical protein